MPERPENLYVHFPFCRQKCTYCNLYSRTGSTQDCRNAYAQRLAPLCAGHYKTAYFGGGSPAMCDLEPILNCVNATEFTVELHPLDVTEQLLAKLLSGGVNRISMGLQSFDDGILEKMGRGYRLHDAEKAFKLIRQYFDNAGVDLIIGYPGDDQTDISRSLHMLADWGIVHCSVYSMQNERGLKGVPDDDTVLDRIRAASTALREIGLERYEISNYAIPGRECAHNIAVWNGKDYLGIGDGAAGRIGLKRTMNFGCSNEKTESVSPHADDIERTIFQLRTKYGLDTSRHPEWVRPLERFANEGLLVASKRTYRLTERGTEVCDTILAELV